MIAKRLFDIAGSAVGLMLLLPILAAIALAVRLESRGPALFRQERVGRGGRPFMIHKFRTMKVAPAGAGPQITIGADRRITRLGAVLRQYKLDELPQLFDVLRGKMSLVGPRPEVPRYVAHYPPQLRDKVLSVRPGITDPASIVFRSESELLGQAADPERFYIEELIPQKLNHACDYIDRMSVFRDLAIILRTVRAI
jgi:lipopolysaccharide/colanic/teichoic acid biosynthesis glycosyltransferase